MSTWLGRWHQGGCCWRQDYLVRFEDPFQSADNTARTLGTPVSASSARPGLTCSSARPGLTCSSARPGLTCSSARPGLTCSSARPGQARSDLQLLDRTLAVHNDLRSPGGASGGIGALKCRHGSRENSGLQCGCVGLYRPGHWATERQFLEMLLSTRGAFLSMI
jgi:hypothetical protein